MEASVLFVCLGNICRSPTAEGVFRHKVRLAGLENRIHIDSAGTGAWHVGNPPDSRAQSVAAARGISMAGQRARKVRYEDFERFDYVLAMDRENLEDLRAMAPDEHYDKIRLFLEFAEQRAETEVPDPYYGGPQGFEHVFDLVEEAADGLLADIVERYRF